MQAGNWYQLLMTGGSVVVVFNGHLSSQGRTADAGEAVVQQALSALAASLKEVSRWVPRDMSESEVMRCLARGDLGDRVVSATLVIFLRKVKGDNATQEALFLAAARTVCNHLELAWE